MQARRFAQVFGAVYVLVGVLGFVFTGLSDFAAPSDDKLILFGVNPLHNLVHICTTWSTSPSGRCGWRRPAASRAPAPSAP